MKAFQSRVSEWSLVATSHFSKRSRCMTQLRTLARVRFNSSDAPASPLLLKLRNDLKTAMRSKDTNRLNVVRGILNEVTNATKSGSPIKTDMQLLSLVRKRSAAAETAKKQFGDAGRTDLVEQENAQIGVLNEYADSVETWDDDKIKAAVTSAVESMKTAGTKVSMGDVLKKLFAAGGDLDGQPVEKAKVSIAVKQLLGGGPTTQ